MYVSLNTSLAWKVQNSLLELTFTINYNINRILFLLFRRKSNKTDFRLVRQSEINENRDEIHGVKLFRDERAIIK